MALKGLDIRPALSGLALKIAPEIRLSLVRDRHRILLHLDSGGKGHLPKRPVRRFLNRVLVDGCLSRLDDHNVTTPLGVVCPCFLQVAPGGTHQMGLLFRSNRLLRRAVRAAKSSLYLNKYECVAIFCDEIERLLHDRFPQLDVIRLQKPTYTKPAPGDLRDEVGERCQAVIQALAD